MTILSDLISQINALDSNSTPSQIYRVVHKLDDFNTHGDGTEVIRYYDSIGAMPTDSAFVGTLLMSSNGIMYRLRDSGGLLWDSAMSLQPPVTKAVSGAGPSTATGNLQATVAGYVVGGTSPTLPVYKFIQRYDFASNTTSLSGVYISSTNSVNNNRLSGASSTEAGYLYVGPAINTIEKFPFANGGSQGGIGSLSVERIGTSGVTGTTGGYLCSGRDLPTNPYGTNIDKYLFASDGNATLIGNTTVSHSFIEGASSPTHGYLAGGYIVPTITNKIERFPFASDGNATLMTALALQKHSFAAAQSTTDGYQQGGASPYVNSIYKYPFTSDTSAVSTGTLTSNLGNAAGASSTTYAYVASGYTGGYTDVVQRFPFASGGNSSNVATLKVAVHTGSQAQE